MLIDVVATSLYTSCCEHDQSLYHVRYTRPTFRHMITTVLYVVYFKICCIRQALRRIFVFMSMDFVTTGLSNALSVAMRTAQSRFFHGEYIRFENTDRIWMHIQSTHHM